MPTRNRAAVIADAIRSVQGQRWPDWELIVVDDGSHDDTASVVAEFLGDLRIRYVKQDQAGAASARNHALRLSRGALIAYLDSDNFWYPDYLRAAVAAFAADTTLESAYGAMLTESHYAHGPIILFEPFDREQLEKGNFIDLNVYVHRRRLFERLGGFDEELSRLLDWDLTLRFTRDAPARRLPILAARYRVAGDSRLSKIKPYGPNYFRVVLKTLQEARSPRRPRVLYALWHHPELSKTYVETEMRCMKRFGVSIDVWSEDSAASPHEPTVPVYRGALAEAIERSRPDIIHIHWATTAIQNASELAGSKLPITARYHGFEVNAEAMRAALALPGIQRIFCFPHQMGLARGDPRFRAMNVGFDTTLFGPSEDKETRLVLRSCAARPSRDLATFFDIAKRLPNHHFVLAIATCKQTESYVDEVRALWRAYGQPGELIVDMPRDGIVQLMKRAGVYLHTMQALASTRTPFGMPISIAESMATGAHVLARDIPPFATYVGEAGQVYRDADHATALIEQTISWSEEEWSGAWMRSVDRAFTKYADGTALHPLYDEWCAIAAKPQIPTAS